MSPRCGSGASGIMPQVRHCRLFLTSQPQQNNILWSSGSFFFFLCSFQAVHSWKKTQRTREAEEATELSPSLCVYILNTYICVRVYIHVYTHTHTYTLFFHLTDKQYNPLVSNRMREGRGPNNVTQWAGDEGAAVNITQHPPRNKLNTKTLQQR